MKYRKKPVEIEAFKYGFEPIQCRWLKYLGNTVKLKHISKENVW